MYTLPRRSALAAFLLLLPLPLVAQTAPEPDQPEVTVIVTAERAEQPASESIASAAVITAKEIREQGARTVADVLRLVPGATLRQSGQLGAVSVAHVRGAEANQVLVLLDGQRISSSAFLGGADLSKLPTADISRIEVIRGPVSSLYGSEAIGGVINIISKRPTEAGGEAVLGFGDNGRAERTLSLRGGTERMAWQFTGSSPAFSGTRPNSDYSATDLSARVVLPSVKGWELSMRAERYHDSLGLPDADPNHTGYADPDDHQWWDRENFDLSAKRGLVAGEAEWRAYRITQRLHNLSPGIDWEGDPVVYDSRITGTTKAMETTYRLERGAHRWVFGGEYRDEAYEDMEGGGAPSTQRKTITNRALFVQDRRAIGPRTDLVLGTRLDDHSTAGSKMTPRIGVSHVVAPRVRARLSYAEGFRAPNFVQLYYNTSWGTGNPNLRPEKSRQYELGLNIQRKDDVIDLAVFTSRVRDRITWVTDPETYRGTYENVERAGQRGFEVAWNRRLSDSAHLSLCYSYVDARNRTQDTRLPGIPHNQISLTAATKLKSWDVALTGRWSDRRPDLAFDPITWLPRQVMLSGRAVFDLSLTRRGGKRGDPYVIIRNLTDASYEEVLGFPAEGLSIEMGMRSSW